MKKDKLTLQISVDIVIVKDGSEYHGFCPPFKGLHVPGKTVKETLKNAKEAIAGYIISLIKHDEPIPFCKIIENTKIGDSKQKINK